MKEFSGKLGNYKIILTEDNTETVWSEFFDENCHNTSGAREETIYNYIQGCHILEQLDLYPELNVFDVGFGPGLGLYYLLESTREKNKTINYYSIELDPELVTWALANTFKLTSFESITKHELNIIQFSLEHINCTLFIGDGRKTILQAFKHHLIHPIHAIFQDAFSPKKNPVLWTVEWFTLLKNISHPKVHLSTYSSSISIRKSLIEAGFIISNHKGFGKKRTMTKAQLWGEMTPELLAELARSPTPALHD